MIHVWLSEKVMRQSSKWISFTVFRISCYGETFKILKLVWFNDNLLLAHWFFQHGIDVYFFGRLIQSEPFQLEKWTLAHFALIQRHVFHHLQLSFKLIFVNLFWLLVGEQQVSVSQPRKDETIFCCYGWCVGCFWELEHCLLGKRKENLLQLSSKIFCGDQTNLE